MKAFWIQSVFLGAALAGGVTSHAAPASAAAACEVQYVKTQQWSDRFNANITVKNSGTTTFSSWTLHFTFSGNQKITNLWGASFAQSGQQVTLKNGPTLSPGGTAAIGFTAMVSGPNASPRTFRLQPAGITCMAR